MENMPRISEAEWEVMKVLWESAPLTASDIIEKMSGKINWKPKTVKTLISRLLKKKAIGFDKNERVYSYYPLALKEDCIRAESQSFLDRVYGGELNVMFATFLNSKPLNPEEVEELKRILDQKKKE